MEYTSNAGLCSERKNKFILFYFCFAVTLQLLRKRVKMNLSNIGKELIQIVEVVSRPVRRNALFIATMMAVWGVTVWCEIQYEGDVLLHTAELILDLYILCVILCLLPRKIACVVRAILYVAGYLLSFFEVFLTERFVMIYMPTTIRLWLETTGEETKEFFAAYFGGDALWHTLCVFIPILVVNIVLAVFGNKWKAKIRLKPIVHPIVNVLMVVLLLVCIPSWTIEKGNMVTFFKQRSTQSAEIVRWQTFYTPFFRLLYSFKMLHLADKAMVNLKNNMKHLEINSCSHRLPQIVLVIGESYNKYHSQLYGYNRPTTPNQFRMAQHDSLIAFRNVVSPWNLTSNVFKDMFSTHSIGQPGTWCDGVLFPAIFRKAGYKVAFMTNQFQQVNRRSGSDFNGSFFLNDPEMDDLCFDFRSRIVYHYDRVFIKEYMKYKPAKYNFVIFHLYGQHQKYDFRFTDRDIYFTADSMRDRKNLAGWMKQTVADYDNATRENDEVFQSICNYFQDQDAIVIYLSDHGEQIFDHSLILGRTPADPIIPLVAHYEFEIPMVMWFSPKMRRLHPTIVKRARRAVMRPFMTDDLCHMLMGLAGIKSKYYNPKRDLLSRYFDTGRKRLLKGKYDYDSIIGGTRFERERLNTDTTFFSWIGKPLQPKCNKK